MTEINFKRVQFSVLGVLIIIFGFLYWFLNTSYFLEKEYLNFKKLEFKATVSTKFDEHPVRGNKIYLSKGPELIVYRELFDKLKIGDSVIKRADSDSIYFFTDYGVVIDDYNDFKRKKYLEKLK